MKHLLLIISLFAISFSANAQALLTPYEASDGKACETYEEVLEYCIKLSDDFEQANYMVYGQSSRLYDLPMLIIDKEGFGDPQKIHQSGRAILMVQASIHPGESDGTSAGLMLARDLLIDKEKNKLLDNVSLIFLPIVNADGYNRRSPYNRINQNGPDEMGWRTNAQNINMNRDFLRSETPAMKAWHKNFDFYMPDFFIDCHTTNGADYQYAITYDLPIYGNMEPSQTAWLKTQYLDPLKSEMEKKSFLMFRYVSFRNWHNPKSGISAWVSSPALSQGYTAIKNRAGLLLETHMLKPYKVRVESTYAAILSSMELIGKSASSLKFINREADKYTASESFRKKPYAVNYKASDEVRKVEFLGVEYVKDSSELTGGTWYNYSGPEKTMEINFYDDMQAVEFVQIPRAYIIPPEWTDLIERLDIHGINYVRLDKAELFDVTMLYLNNVTFAERPYEGAFRVRDFDVDSITGSYEFPKHSVVVHTDTKYAKVIAHLIDPTAPSSLLRWGYFNAIFEQKEYAENYVMEVMAPEMIAKNPDLLTEFKQYLDKNPEVKGNQGLMLSWFYQRTAYWDKQKDLYPIGFVY